MMNLKPFCLLFDSSLAVHQTNTFCFMHACYLLQGFLMTRNRPDQILLRKFSLRTPNLQELEPIWGRNLIFIGYPSVVFPSTLLAEVTLP